MIRFNFCARLNTRRVALVALVLIAGCGEKGPKIYPSKGRVVIKGTGEVATQLQGASIYMEQVEDPKVTAVTEIDDDGTFQLGSVVDGRPYQGLPPGTYRARISPTTVFGKQFILPKYENFKTSSLQCTIAPGSTQVEIEVERVGRK